MPKVDDQIAVLQQISTDVAAQTVAIQEQTTAIQQLTAAVQSQQADLADNLTVQKYHAETMEHYVDYMTGTVTHADPLP